MTDAKDNALIAGNCGHVINKLLYGVCPICAIDRIEALTAERDEARMMYAGASSAYQQHILEAADRIRKAEAERDALLKAIGNAQYSLSGYAPPEFNSAAAILMNAVAALKAQQPAPERTPEGR